MKFLNFFRQSRSYLSTQTNRRILTPRILGYRFKSMVKENENLQYDVCINTCGPLYERWREERRFPTVPTGNLNFKVNYIDTHKNLSSNLKDYLPTVVALHGAPGSCRDFASLISYLHQSGARVVAPTFPDFSVCNPGIFRHTPEEKAQFVKDFLQVLSISTIDVLVVHSSAVYPGLQLCLDNEPLVKSFVMLNPAMHTYDMKATQNLKYMKMMVKACEIPIVFKFMILVMPSILRMFKTPVRTDNFIDPLLSSTAMVHANIPKAKEQYLQLSKSGLPLLYAFSEDDKLMGKTCSYNLANLLGASNSDIYIYDTNGCIKQNDFSVCSPGVFRHTAEEKAQFVKDFLQALSISSLTGLPNGAVNPFGFTQHNNMSPLCKGRVCFLLNRRGREGKRIGYFMSRATPQQNNDDHQIGIFDCKIRLTTTNYNPGDK